MPESDTLPSLAEFIEAHRITANVLPVPVNPNMPDAQADARHWEVTLISMEPGAGSPMRVYFTTGSALPEPTAADVLSCLALDASGYEDGYGARTFEEWAEEYGYDTDSRAAERTYNAVKVQTDDLRAFLGTDAFEALLWNTEVE